MKTGWLRLALWLWLVMASATAFAEVAVPELKARVTDLTGTLSVSQQAELEKSLAAFEAKKGSQIAILLVPTTQPESIEQFSMRVAESWKLGRKGVDDGVLILVAKNDRSLRIEVGYGLEGVVPDVVAKRIVSEIITPQFKQGRFFEGLQEGVARVVGVVEGEPLPPPPEPSEGDTSEDWWGAVFVVAVLGGGMLRAIFGALFGASIAAAIAGGVVWLIAGAWGMAAFAAIVVFIITLLGGGAGGGRSGGGWSSGSSGGGFSGGGGGFGGGGASGRW